MKNYKLLSLVFFFLTAVLWAQNTITISGKLHDDKNNPIREVYITESLNHKSTTTDENGFYSIEVPKGKKFTLYYRHENFKSLDINYNATYSSIKKDIQMLTEISTNVGEVVFQGTRKPQDISAVTISSKDIDKLPSMSGGVTELLRTLPYVNTNSELSSQYMVRGGNFDENLVYINGVEVYKPFLVRSGQQEGLSIINPDMASMLSFSAGGFEARYGDKMSSVLDIYYRRPKAFESSLEASLIGGSATIGFADKKQKLSALFGARYRNTNLILNTLDGDTNFNPTYWDFQSYIEYDFHPKWSLSFLGNYSSNDYEMKPKTRETTFGTYNQPIRLTVYYNGKENDKYLSANGSLSLKFKPNDKLLFSADAYAFHTKEEEYFDIAAGYSIEQYDDETQSTVTSFGTGGQIDHARNDLDMLVLGGQFRSRYKFDENSNIEAGVQFQREDIRDFMNEWQLIDSTGYSLPRPAMPPGELDPSELVLNYHISARNDLKSNRINGYVQYFKKFYWGTNRVMINAGIRGTHWDFNDETNISPRVQFAIKPDWEKRDMLFRFAVGMYYQPPFYKEIRRLDGSINENIKSQKSIHFILGNDYEFKWRDKPFKLTTELYYKSMDDLIPYYVDNVRIKYTGENNSKGYAYGIDTRLNTEFVKGADSWLSFSYARTKESIDGQGYIPRPTDQRFKVGLFFQDYMKFYPSMKASINLVYASGLPNGAPLFTNPYSYQSTLPAYKRVDVGLTKVFIDQGQFKSNSGVWSKFKELSLGLEIFNIFDIKNTVSNQWLRDVNSSRYYAVPNRLTGRFFNLKLWMKF